MTDFLDAFLAIEAIVRRHLPSCMYLVDLAMKPLPANSGNPARFEVIAYVQRISSEPDPGGWGYELAQEVRRGWDQSEFSFRVHTLLSPYEHVIGRYAE